MTRKLKLSGGWVGEGAENVALKIYDENFLTKINEKRKLAGKAAIKPTINDPVILKIRKEGAGSFGNKPDWLQKIHGDLCTAKAATCLEEIDLDAGLWQISEEAKGPDLEQLIESALPETKKAELEGLNSGYTRFKDELRKNADEAKLAVQKRALDEGTEKLELDDIERIYDERLKNAQQIVVNKRQEILQPLYADGKFDAVNYEGKTINVRQKTEQLFARLQEADVEVLDAHWRNLKCIDADCTDLVVVDLGAATQGDYSTITETIVADNYVRNALTGGNYDISPGIGRLLEQNQYTPGRVSLEEAVGTPHPAICGGAIHPGILVGTAIDTGCGLEGIVEGALPGGVPTTVEVKTENIIAPLKTEYLKQGQTLEVIAQRHPTVPIQKAEVTLSEKIGEGSLARVYGGSIEGVGDDLAFKAAKGPGTDGRIIDTIFDEAAKAPEICQHVSCPGYYGIYEVDGVPFLVQDRVEGRHLSQLTDQEVIHHFTPEKTEKLRNELANAGQAGWEAGDLQVMVLTKDQTLAGLAYKEGDLVVVDVEKWKKVEGTVADNGLPFKSSIEDRIQKAHQQLGQKTTRAIAKEDGLFWLDGKDYYKEGGKWKQKQNFWFDKKVDDAEVIEQLEIALANTQSVKLDPETIRQLEITKAAPSKNVQPARTIDISGPREPDLGENIVVQDFQLNTIEGKVKHKNDAFFFIEKQDGTVIQVSRERIDLATLGRSGPAPLPEGYITTLTPVEGQPEWNKFVDAVNNHPGNVLSSHIKNELTSSPQFIAEGLEGIVGDVPEEVRKILNLPEDAVIKVRVRPSITPFEKQAELLNRLAERGITPKAYGGSGDFYLAKKVDGIPLAQLSPAEREALRPQLERIADILTEEGMRITDLDGTNLIRTPAGEVLLIDAGAPKGSISPAKTREFYDGKINEIIEGKKANSLDELQPIDLPSCPIGAITGKAADIPCVSAAAPRLLADLEEGQSFRIRSKSGNSYGGIYHSANDEFIHFQTGEKKSFFQRLFGGEEKSETLRITNLDQSSIIKEGAEIRITGNNGVPYIGKYAGEDAEFFRITYENGDTVRFRKDDLDFKTLVGEGESVTLRSKSGNVYSGQYVTEARGNIILRDEAGKPFALKSDKVDRSSIKPAGAQVRDAKNKLYADLFADPVKFPSHQDAGKHAKDLIFADEKTPRRVIYGLEDRIAAEEAGFIFENVPPTNLPPGEYTYVILEDGSMVFGKVTNNVEFGVKHLHLANGRSVKVAGEIAIDGTGKYVYNLRSGTFTSPILDKKFNQFEHLGVAAAQQEVAKFETALQKNVDTVFDSYFGRKGDFTKVEVLPNQPASLDELVDICLKNAGLNLPSCGSDDVRILVEQRRGVVANVGCAVAGGAIHGAACKVPEPRLEEVEATVELERTKFTGGIDNLVQLESKPLLSMEDVRARNDVLAQSTFGHGYSEEEIDLLSAKYRTQLREKSLIKDAKAESSVFLAESRLNNLYRESFNVDGGLLDFIGGIDHRFPPEVQKVHLGTDGIEYLDYTYRLMTDNPNPNSIAHYISRKKLATKDELQKLLATSSKQDFREIEFALYVNFGNIRLNSDMYAIIYDATAKVAENSLDKKGVFEQALAELFDQRIMAVPENREKVVGR